MKKKNKFYLVECCTGELLESGTLEEVMDIPKSQAEAYNGGLIRYWFKEGRLYIDAGGNVLYIKADTDEGTQELFDLFFGEVKVC